MDYTQEQINETIENITYLRQLTTDKQNELDFQAKYLSAVEGCLALLESLLNEKLNPTLPV